MDNLIPEWQSPCSEPPYTQGYSPSYYHVGVWLLLSTVTVQACVVAWLWLNAFGQWVKP